MIHKAMNDRAHALIAKDAETSHRANGCCYPGAKRKRHKPYTIPPRAAQMVTLLGKGDANGVAALIHVWNDLNASEGAP